MFGDEKTTEISKKEIDYIFKIFEEGYAEGYREATMSLVMQMTGLRMTLPENFNPLSCNDREFYYRTFSDYLEGKDLNYAKRFKRITSNILEARDLAFFGIESKEKACE